MRVLIAVDESAHSEAALKAVLDRPWVAGTQFKVVSVVEPFHPEYAGWHTSYVPLALDAQRELVESTGRLIEKATTRLGAKFGEDQVTGAVLEGYIKDRIIEVARDWPADLIVIGSHGRRGFTRFLLGSVSEAVVCHAPCSVEVVKLPGGDA